MVSEPNDAPVPNASKGRYYIGLAVAIVLGGLLVLFVFPNLVALTNEGPAVDDDFQVTLPSADGLERVDPLD
ncbi:hypothetical protein JANAI62_34080 [Jannaschia pagri]|uniref:Uncharacterized protein n=1 Tax=Jannaschia pagri TaxID=2829797 RepID=A0ABQ4NQU6_9RHOB|nr:MULTISPECIES: hypothetical protein [unclassified Jannaschia]GIT92950.1 hypothetical protein JANAI61_34080 [Jannaschia sp. AI_61]GIT96785.1 hypothetical protein JANAI62_34080 [Jannaschia sp. AI_62]